MDMDGERNAEHMMAGAARPSDRFYHALPY
mgnify:CR=1 FL=1